MREVSGRSLGSLIVMESDHNDNPVSITDVPNDPDWGVRVEDERQQDNISYHNDGAGQEDHQTNKNLPKKYRAHLILYNNGNFLLLSRVNRQIPTVPNQRVI